jgi:hypothetical protein
MTRPTAVYIGFIGKLPIAGMALANIHAMIGLRDIGYRVHYVERQNFEGDCYDPRTNEMTSDPSTALAYLADLLPRYGFDGHDFSFIDTKNQCHGVGWPELRRIVQDADFVMDMGTGTWFDELAVCARRAFVDVNPMFTQAAMLNPESHESRAVHHFTTLFTEAMRIGQPGCLIPLVGREWIPSRPAVATSIWQADTNGRGGPVTALMNWSSGTAVTHEGRTFGYKDQSFSPFMTLPSRTSWPCSIAIGGRAPREQLGDAGWHVESALGATLTIDRYQEFVAQSAADLGIVKHAYVESRCGWFSDRSTCYLAAGRPVLHQDTGLRDLYPTGEGLLLFSTPEEAVEGLNAIERDYERHARAARAIAEEHFESSTVMRQMLTDAGWL